MVLGPTALQTVKLAPESGSLILFAAGLAAPLAASCEASGLRRALSICATATVSFLNPNFALPGASVGRGAARGVSSGETLTFSAHSGIGRSAPNGAISRASRGLARGQTGYEHCVVR